VLKCSIACVIVVVIDRKLEAPLGELRLLVDIGCYVAIALALRAVDLREVRDFIRSARDTSGEPA
jgi:hypothetical protein